MESHIVTGKYYVRMPQSSVLPIVFDSPHSGFLFPPDFHTIAATSDIITSCDRFVDELWSGAVGNQTTLIGALFPRAYIDPNRDEQDIDGDLIDGLWGTPIHQTDHCRRGMGLIRKFALPHRPLYDRKLSVAEIWHRIEAYYRPYRQVLSQVINERRRQFGTVWHCNCHSMKSKGNGMNVDSGASRPDFVLSDNMGTTAAPDFSRWVADFLEGRGYKVQFNDPYKGGDILRSFGHPSEGCHSLQIEINRSLYLNEVTYEKNTGFGKLKDCLTELSATLGECVKRSIAAA
jgi:N-formylglutamate deformylase